MADFEQEVANLRQQLEDEQAASAEARSELDAARERYESISAELGAKGQNLTDTLVELEQLAVDKEAALAEAESATASVRDRARAQRARAELAEACLAAVADVLERLYAAEDPAEALEEAAGELEEIAADCAPAD